VRATPQGIAVAPQATPTDDDGATGPPSVHQ
jgi:hypothetical protein